MSKDNTFYSNYQEDMLDASRLRSRAEQFLDDTEVQIRFSYTGETAWVTLQDLKEILKG